MKIKSNYTMMTDFYELTMANGYYVAGKKDEICYFDVFYRTIPDNAGYAIFAGLEQVVDYIKELHFDKEDIAYLRSKNCFDEGFLDYLENFKFSGDIYAMPEGTPIFPNEPIMIIRGNAIEAQFIETFVLSELNHQSLIATKANRIVKAAQGKVISEFGARRAHGAEAAILGARAAYIAGCSSTSNVQTDLTYGVPATGTMAHSWVQMFGDELLAFKQYCSIYPDNAVLSNCFCDESLHSLFIKLRSCCRCLLFGIEETENGGSATAHHCGIRPKLKQSFLCPARNRTFRKDRLLKDIINHRCGKLSAFQRGL